MPNVQDAEGEIYCAELGTIDGLTYVAVPDGVTLPENSPGDATLLLWIWDILYQLL